MLVIRLARTGRKKYATYRIVAAESKKAATGKFVALLGHYNPHTKELVLKKEEIQHYLGNGAQPSNSVAKLLKQEKVKLPAWVEIKTAKKAPKKAAEAEEPKEAPAAEETETPAAEAETVAEVAAEQVEAREEASAPADDTNHIETAEAQAAQAEAAEQAEANAAAAATETPAE